MRWLVILLALTTAASAQVHCDPNGCTPSPEALPSEKIPMVGESAASYGLRLSKMRRDHHEERRSNSRTGQQQ